MLNFTEEEAFDATEQEAEQRAERVQSTDSELSSPTQAPERRSVSQLRQLYERMWGICVLINETPGVEAAKRYLTRWQNFPDKILEMYFSFTAKN